MKLCETARAATIHHIYLKRNTSIHSCNVKIEGIFEPWTCYANLLSFRFCASNAEHKIILIPIHCITTINIVKNIYKIVYHKSSTVQIFTFYNNVKQTHSTAFVIFITVMEL